MQHLPLACGREELCGNQGHRHLLTLCQGHTLTMPQKKRVLAPQKRASKAPAGPAHEGKTPEVLAEKSPHVTEDYSGIQQWGNWDKAVSDWGNWEYPVGIGCCQAGRAGPTSKFPLAQGHFSLPLWALAGHGGTKFIPNHNCHLCWQLWPYRMCWK